jgi:CheY-like chemotaxis protein
VSLPSVPTESPEVLWPFPDADAGTAAWSAKAVLIVDDSSFFRELLADVLKPLHLRLLMAGDGAEALQLIRQKHPALVILDLNLPGMSGYDLIRQVRADPALGGLRLLAMSGIYRKETDAAEVHAAGADDFLSKSFNPEQLQLRVKKLLVDQE